MKTKLTWFDRIMAAVTFAEASEHDTGMEFLHSIDRRLDEERKCRECDAVLTSDLHGAEVHS